MQKITTYVFFTTLAAGKSIFNFPHKMCQLLITDYSKLSERGQGRRFGRGISIHGVTETQELQMHYRGEGPAFRLHCSPLCVHDLKKKINIHHSKELKFFTENLLTFCSRKESTETEPTDLDETYLTGVDDAGVWEDQSESNHALVNNVTVKMLTYQAEDSQYCCKNCLPNQLIRCGGMSSRNKELFICTLANSDKQACSVK